MWWVCIAVMVVAAGLAATVIYKISNTQEARRLEPAQQPGDGRERQRTGEG